MDKPGARGLTLIELMVTIAVSSVIMTAAVSLLVSMSQVKREGERLLEVTSAGSIALAQIEFDLANTGYRFPIPAFGLRIWNNVDAATSIDTAPAITVNANCGGPGLGLLPGTDVLEVARGFSEQPPGTVLGVTYGPSGGPPAVGANQVRFNLLTPGFPFNGVEAGSNTVLMASDPAGNACLLKVAAPVDYLGPTVVADYLTQDYTFDPDPANHYVSPTGIRCPRNGDHVYRLSGQIARTRYMICYDPLNPEVRPALYRQLSVAGTEVFGVPQLMQEGVEDLQVAPRYQERIAGGLGAPAGSCTTGAPISCTCDYTSGACTGLNPVPPVLNANSPVNWLRSITLGLVSISTRQARDGQSRNFLRPALADHPAGAVPDGNKRIVKQRTIALSNFGVTP